MDRRKFIKIASSGTVGFSLTLAAHNTLYDSDAEAISWIAATVTGLSLINGVFRLGQNIRGLLKLRNDSRISQRGYLGYEIIDENRNIIEVSEGGSVIANPGYTSINFSCSACHTPGRKTLCISTEYGVARIGFNVVSERRIRQPSSNHCHNHSTFSHCH